MTQAPVERPWRIEQGDLRLFVRLTPRGGRDGLDGVEIRDDGRPVLKARVRAAPEDGHANAALVKLLAKTLGVSASQVRVTAGHTARVKALSISGDTAELELMAAMLARLTGG